MKLVEACDITGAVSEGQDNFLTVTNSLIRCVALQSNGTAFNQSWSSRRALDGALPLRSICSRVSCASEKKGKKHKKARCNALSRSLSHCFSQWLLTRNSPGTRWSVGIFGGGSAWGVVYFIFSEMITELQVGWCWVIRGWWLKVDVTNCNAIIQIVITSYIIRSYMIIRTDDHRWGCHRFIDDLWSSIYRMDQQAQPMSLDPHRDSWIWTRTWSIWVDNLWSFSKSWRPSQWSCFVIFTNCCLGSLQRNEKNKSLGYCTKK